MVKRTMTERSGPDGPTSRRALQAEQTRTEILASARRLFASQGYASTTLRDIAADAGVSVQTVFNSVGSKAELVRRLNDLIDAEAQIGEIARELQDETDPTIVATISARITRRIVERCGDIVRTSFEAARNEPGLSETAAEGGRRHRAGAARVAARLAELGALAPGLDEDHAATTLAALSDTRLAFALLDDYDLDLDAIEAWMCETTRQAVLGR
jgi:AcrR family transcriptional regulator